MNKLLSKFKHAIIKFMPKKLLKIVARKRARHSKLVSIIVPVYNVEKYLNECLKSITAQSYRNIEVVIIDDGSTDSSYKIAKKYARIDSRIRLFRQKNAGLGAARNSGLKRSKGAFVTFVDSDDSLPLNAIEGLMRPMQGAETIDISVGGLTRFNSKRTWVPEWFDRVHSAPKVIQKIDDHLPLLRNNYTCTKIFRKSFLDSTGARFREGVAYEDQPLVTELYLAASGIAVIEHSVYNYRARDDGSSISQQTHSLRDLEHRILAWRETVRILNQYQNSLVTFEWYRTIFETHLHWYLNNDSALKNEKYWEILRSVFLELLQSAPKDILGSIPPQQIIPLGLLAENRILDLADFRSIDGYRKGTFPLEKIKNKWRLTGVNSRFESKLSAQHAIMPEDRLKLVHQMRSAYWTRTNIPELVITGFCYLEQVDTCSTEFERILEFRDRDGMTVLTVHGNESEDEDLIPGQSATGVSYARAGVIFSIPLTDFERVIPQNSRRKDLDVYFVLRSGSFTSSTRVTNFSAWSNAGELPVASNKNGIKVDANFRDGSFRVRLNRIDYEVFRIDAIGSEAIIHVRSLTTVPSPSALQIHHASSGEKISVSRIDEADEQGSNTNISGWKVDFSTEDGELYRKGIYEVRALREDGLGTPIAYYPSDQSPIWMESKMRARPSARGNLTFIRESSKGLIKSLDVLPNGKVVVVFTLFSEVPFKQPILHFKGRGQETDEILAELQDDGSFSAEVPVAITKFALAQFPKRGAFNLVLQVEVDGSKQSIPLVLTQPVRDNLPRRTYLSQSMLVLLPSPSNHLHLSIRPALRANERTNFNQHRMKKTLQSSSEIEPAFLFRSYFGENVSCNGLAVAKELLSRGVSFPIYAAVQDQSVLVPDGIRPVLVGSERWYQLLNSAKYYMDNMYQPIDHYKSEGQVLIQTFHGYPFKLMGHQLWEKDGVDAERTVQYDRRANEWNYLVSPAPYATPLLRRDFRYEGEVLEIGYPRNDELLAPDASARRSHVRKKLGIQENVTAVLYAPTFRDSGSSDGHTARFEDILGLEQLAEELGDRYVILLRGHAFHSRVAEQRSRAAQVIDVTDYQHVTDLYHAADVAIVDYSSLRFDFAVTGKPMVFFVPDLVKYKEDRGWVVGFEETAPGPLLTTRAEVAAVLQDLDAVVKDYAEARATFASDFIPLEDGHASARLVDRVFVPRGDVGPA